ncbi:DUF5011/hyalin repeat domain-containing protein [Algicola sagamiensis]|uniref:hypothetical protein n=1 Tax=Algicola sagamiensis TaxID=163869 RepID=UPI0003A9AA3F|nr:hypothetical protein [Algicola sagamiensis]
MRYSVSDNAFAIDDHGRITVNKSLKPGDHTLTIQVVDADGNITEKSIAVIVGNEKSAKKESGKSDSGSMVYLLVGLLGLLRLRRNNAEKAIFNHKRWCGCTTFHFHNGCFGPA